MEGIIKLTQIFIFISDKSDFLRGKISWLPLADIVSFPQVFAERVFSVVNFCAALDCAGEDLFSPFVGSSNVVSNMVLLFKCAVTAWIFTGIRPDVGIVGVLSIVLLKCLLGDEARLTLITAMSVWVGVSDPVKSEIGTRAERLAAILALVGLDLKMDVLVVVKNAPIRERGTARWKITFERLLV